MWYMVCSLDYVVWYVVCGMWYVVCGMWYVVCGMWYVICVYVYLVSSIWSVCIWYVVCGMWYVICMYVYPVSSIWSVCIWYVVCMYVVCGMWYVVSGIWYRYLASGICIWYLVSVYLISIWYRGEVFMFVDVSVPRACCIAKNLRDQGYKSVMVFDVTNEKLFFGPRNGNACDMVFVTPTSVMVSVCIGFCSYKKGRCYVCLFCSGLCVLSVCVCLCVCLTVCLTLCLYLSVHLCVSVSV